MQMGLNIRENGNQIKLMEKDIWSTLIVINTTETGFKDNKMVKELTHFQMVVNMMVALLMICQKDLVLWYILISTNIRENLEVEFVTVQANAITTTMIYMKVNG